MGAYSYLQKDWLSRGYVFIRLNTAFIFFVVLSITGCAATGPKFSEEIVPPGKAVVYIYRESRILGAANVYTVLSDHGTWAHIVNGGYWVDIVEPGHTSYRYTTTTYPASPKQYSFLELWKNSGPVGDIVTEAGKEYFMKVNMHFSGMILERQPKDTGLEDIRDMSRIFGSRIVWVMN